MGSKGSQTQTQSYQANPAITGAGTQALNMAQTAANRPFNLPAAPVAGFSNDQSQAFDQTRQAQGMAQPYFNAATNYAMQSANPITGEDVARNYNPFAQNVFSNLQNEFGRQSRDVTGKLRQAAGGVGADRIAVGQSELARNQGLAYGQTAAGLYGQAQQMSQADKARQAQAGFAMAQFGPAAQNAYMQGTNQLYGMGAQQQGLSQAQQMAEYNRKLQEEGYNFQVPQWLAGITGGLSGAFGGTQTKTTAPPPLINQLLGAGTGLAGFGNSQGWWGNNGNVAADPNVNADTNPSLIGRDGGRVNGYAIGGDVQQEPQVIPGSKSIVPYLPMQPSAGPKPWIEDSAKKSNGFSDAVSAAGNIAKIAMMFARGGGRVASQGGAVSPYDMHQGFAGGGDVELPPIEMDQFPGQPDVAAQFPGGQERWRQGVDADMAAGQTGSDLPPQFTSMDSALPPGTMAYDAPPRSGARMPLPQAQGQSSYQPYQLPYDVDSRNSVARNANRGTGMPLMAMGAAMAGSYGSPFNALAQGFGAYGEATGKQREAERHEHDTNIKADALMKDWQNHLDEFTKMKPYQQAEIDLKKQLQARQLKQLELEGLKPFKIGEDPDTGLDIYGVRSAKDGKIVPIDPKTGQPREAVSAEMKPEPVPRPEEPAPLGVPELATNLNPSKSNATQRLKGPFATQEASNIKNIDQQMNKTRDAIDAQKDSLARLKIAYSTIMKDNDGDGFFKRWLFMPGAGPTPESRAARARELNAINKAAKKPPMFDEAKIAAIEEANKIQYTMGTTFASTISPRDSQQMQLGAIAAQPGFTQSPQGMQRLIGIYDGLSNHGEAKHNFWGRWRETNPRTAVGWEEDFRTKNPVEKYTVRALLENAPDQKSLAKLPDAIKVLRDNKNDPEAIKAFDRRYNGTSSYFLNGRLDPYAGMK